MPHSPTKHKSKFYKPELDVLRFGAFLLVFCAHVPAIPLWFGPIQSVGSFGLSIFFALSAYLIVTLLIKEVETTGTVQIRSFAIRRILRIWPLYFAIIAAGYGMGLIWPRVALGKGFVLALSALVGNFWIARHGWTATGVIGPLWSISIEEQFYLAIPLIAKIGGRRLLWYVCFITLIGSYATIAWLGLHRAIPNQNVWVNTLVESQFFAAGGIIALLTCRRAIQLDRRLRLITIGVGIFLFYVAARYCGLTASVAKSPTQLLLGYLILLAGTAGILLATLNFPLRFPQILLYLGKISYGLYLFHLPFLRLFCELGVLPASLIQSPNHHSVRFLMNAFRVLLAATCTFACASLSYRFFEKPFLKLKGKFETIDTRAI